MPDRRPGQFYPGDPRINKSGRPPSGQSFADEVRAIVGASGIKLAEMWAAVAYGYAPSDDGSSSRALYLTALRTLQNQAEVSDRIMCSKLLAERGFGKPKEDTTVNGTLRVTWEK